MRKIIIAASLASMLLGTPALAISPTIPVSELPDLHQEPQHQVTSKRVAGLFTRSHYHHIALDDAFSKKIFERFLEQLDYRRNVLLQSDVDALQPYATQFDDMIKTGELEPAYKMFHLVQQRSYERFAYALSLLDKDKPMNFDVPGDKYVFDRKDAAWPKTAAELNELWRQRVKYDALSLKLTGKTWPETVDILQKRYNNAIKRMKQTNSEDVFQGVMNAFARSIEPHTSYLSPRNAERFEMEMNLSLEGIGAVLQMEDDYTIIKSLVAGGPAALSGKLAVDDKIVGVGQDNGEMVDVIGWRLDDVVELIKGPKGSKVTLQVLPKKGGSNAKPFTVTMTRDKIRLEDRAATSKVIEPEQGPYAHRKVGVITVPGFYMNLSNDVANELQKLQADKVEGIVIDLRGNGGGALTEATLMTGLFIDQGPVVQIRDASGRISENSDNDGKTYYAGPLTLLVDRYSASASEIFAAALQDYGRALIVGESTFGKGTVQQHRGLGRIYDMYDKPIGHVQYTIAKFYRINGGSTQRKGVTPDIPFPSALEPGEYGESEEDNALPWDQVPAANYQPLNEITKPLVANLEQRHEQRLKNSVEFGYIMDDIKTFKKHHKEKSVSLVESERLKDREDEDAKALARLNDRRQVHGLAALKSLEDEDNVSEAEKKIAEPDTFLDEAVDITLDMVDYDKTAQNRLH
ncbi:carboxy terminal-processing peptidase [Shewanella dokdonensis]|uniref:Carboxy terminal-processing peptidase n=1 Tax=Shewanella dokdonensis TaxID=712036 RepID=A0ABX8DDW7_9GAMM|nr:carboxy terminal-processing peptidase [Shewanella dokdonensis]MCL1073225.1 carboxy terminal-processing peptidase [Shewanella dokdonensis]QVK22929.1 carboxy terminal-processing peptidase [Shewanella dokdonensis]